MRIQPTIKPVKRDTNCVRVAVEVPHQLMACPQTQVYNNRRTLLTLATAFLTTTSFAPSSKRVGLLQDAAAACLQGDISVDCIGVYKIPMDPEISPFIDTPEHLEKYAPELKYVPPIAAPDSSKMALEDLRTIQIQILAEIRSKVFLGDLLSAGTSVLYILPRVRVDGECILKYWSTDNKQSDIDMFQMSLDRLLVNLNQLDIMLGQALRGQLGALTPAQIQILSLLQDVDEAYKDMLLCLQPRQDVP
jgi:hypothetical protein